jgi:hypothetical protein
MSKKIFSWLIVVSIILIPTLGFIPFNLEISLASNINNQNKITLFYSFNKPDFYKVEFNEESFTRVELDGLPYYGVNGKPRIPVKPLKILLPQTKKPTKINVEILSDPITYKMNEWKNEIELGTQSFRLDQDPQENNQKIETSVNTNRLYPEKLYNNLGIQYFRGYGILNINLHPIRYDELANTILFYNELKLTIETENDTYYSPLFRGISEDKKEIIQIVDNPEMVNNYQNLNNHAQNLLNYDYVIITTKEFKNTQRFKTNPIINNFEYTYTFQDLIEQRKSQGLRCTYKTIEDINNEYDGIDTQEKIRNFIIDAYLNWGTTWILLGGDVEKVPIRFLHDIDGADVKISSDIYYQCLDGNYNYDGDNNWGEKFDGIDGDRIDLYAEIYIGRAPVDDKNDISAFVEKTLTYENSEWDNDEYIKKHLSVGEKVWNGLGGDGAGYVERCIDYCNDYYQSTYGIPSDQYSITPLYERDMNWNYTDILNEINSGVNIINHVGHGAPNGAMKLSTYDIQMILNNTNKYGLFYSQSCHSGQLEEVDECVAEAWVNAEKAGGFAAIMNTGLGYGDTFGYDGPDNRYAREFFDAIFSHKEDISRIGKANQDSKEDNYFRIDEENMYHVYYDTLLFGDPYVKIKKNESNENKNIDVDIIKPKNGIFLINRKILPLFTSIIIGSVDIEITVANSEKLNRVELYIDNEFIKLYSSEPCIWSWDETKFGKHTIKAIAYDDYGYQTDDEITVWKFL